MKLIPITTNNYEAVAQIYVEGIATGYATFETKATAWEQWNQSHFAFGRFLAEDEGTYLGWAALSPVSSRCVYGGVAEVSVYVAAQARGKGVGKTLLQALIDASESNGIWTLQSSIFRENIGSHRLHLSCSFREIGYKEKVGKLHDVWKDNILLERRSKVVGV